MLRTPALALFTALLVLAGCQLIGQTRAPSTPDPAPPPPQAGPAPGTAPPSDTPPAPPEPPRTVLREARLIDGTGAPPRIVDVVIAGDRIEQIGSGLLVPTFAREIQLDGKTLLPGFIDAHVHMTARPAPSSEAATVELVELSDADRALLGAAHARATLRAGFTTVRSLGGTLADRALRDAIAADLIEGPRMLVANYGIGITGGHCDPSNGLRPDVFDALDYRAGIADGPDEVRKAVRYQIKHGADVIKLCASGGVLSTGDGVGASQMTLEELQTAVREARRAGRKVAAHAHGRESIEHAVMAGVDSIEHGSGLDAELVALMQRNGTMLVPTLYVAEYVEDQVKQGVLSAEAAAKIREIAPQIRGGFALARSKVKVALGSDAGVFRHGENAKEFAAMVAQGMAPMDAIVAGTSAGATLLGVPEIGQVRPGFMADLVVVDGDPLTDIRELEQPLMVMKAGRIVVELPESN